MATVRALIMHPTISSSAPNRGLPPAARKAEKRAKGRAKRVWEILMSAAKSWSFPNADCGLRIADWAVAVVMFVDRVVVSSHFRCRWRAWAWRERARPQFHPAN